MSNTTSQIANDVQEPNQPSSHEGLPPDPESPIAASKKTPSCVVLLAIGADTPQYTRLEIKDQLTIGFTDPETDMVPDVDLSAFGAQEMGVANLHAALFAAQGGLHIRDLGSRSGTTLNGFELDANKMYRLRQGDVIELGQLRIEFQIVRLETAFGLQDSAESPVQDPLSNVVPDSVPPFVPPFWDFEGRSEVPTKPFIDDDSPDLEYDADLIPTESGPVATEDLETLDSEGLPDSPVVEEDQIRQTQALPRLEEMQVADPVPPSEEVPQAAQPSLASNWKPASWIALLVIEAQVPQYLALEVNGQLTIGYTDSETSVSPDVNFGPFGAQELGVSRRH